jgi:AraC-like DNA-binding protein
VRFGGSLFRKSLATAAMLCLAQAGRALTLDELLRDTNLSPQSFARRFADFRYCFRAEVQSRQALHELVQRIIA